MNEMYFSFGALADKFSVQCEKQGYKLNNADKWDKLVHCTIMLHIHNVLTDSRYDECLNRILKMYKKDYGRKRILVRKKDKGSGLDG